VIDANTHARYLNYFDNTVWVIDLDCSITGFHAYNGNPVVEIPPQVLCGDISPESKPRDITTRIISAPIFYEEDRIIIASTSGLAPEDRSLSYVVGISLDTQDIVWKTSLVTSPGEILSPGWGQWSIDQEEGIIYIGTGPPSPEWNATHRNGENKYGNSIIALQASTGEIIWNYQTNPHDINNYGCTGNVILGDIEGKKTVYSACMNGYVYALDAETGNLVWYFNPPNVKRLNSENADFVKTNTYDPNKPWLNYPSTDPVVQCPGVFGAVSFNIAMGYNTIYVNTFNSCSKIDVSPVTSMGETGITDKSLLYESVGPVNSTLYAIDAITGDVKWSQYFDEIAMKGGITVSGGLVYIPSPAGNLHVFDAATGLNLWEKNFGALGVFYPPIIGADAYGNWSVIQIVAGSPLLHGLGEYSGYLFSFGPPTGLIDIAIMVTETTETNFTMIATYSAIAVAIVLLVGTIIIYVRRRS
jgi:outer membrane protein assembly factor BamB